MAIKKGDFIEVEYTGKLKEEDIIIDTTDQKTAQDNGIYNPEASYGPVIICVGERHIIKGIDDYLEGKEAKEYTIELAPENAFGKKSAKLLQLIPTSKFLKKKINPAPGLQINVDGQVGVVKKVSGGRTIVDFNHPFSGKDVIYTVKVNKTVTDPKEKLHSLMAMLTGVKKEQLEVSFADGKADVKLPMELPEEIVKQIEDNVKKIIAEVKEFSLSKK